MPDAWYSDVSFSVRAGEIVGLGGLIGSGRTEVARVIFGADPAGKRHDHAQRQGASSRGRPRTRSRPGIGLVPEDRKQQGVILDKPIRVNSTMARDVLGGERLRLSQTGQGTRRCHRARQEPAG